MTILTTTAAQRPSGVWATDEVAAADLPVDKVTNTWRTMLRLVVPVEAGDLLDIDARARVTNDTGYTVGVGWHLWAYDVDSGQGAAGPWWKISPSCGDNVDRIRHHLPLAITGVYVVPDTWPAGHRIVVVLRADAHSTAAVTGDILTVDRTYGHMTVRRWSSA